MNALMELILLMVHVNVRNMMNENEEHCCLLFLFMLVIASNCCLPNKMRLELILILIQIQVFCILYKCY